MPSFTCRAYSAVDDLKRIQDWLARVRSAESATDYPGPSDLRELLAVPAVQAATRLWFGGRGRIIAFALMDPYHNLLFEIDPQAVGPDLEAEVVAWGMECLRKQARGAGQACTLDASCREDDGERLALLERHGFELQPVRSLRLVRSLREPVSQPALPAGFRIHPSQGRDEVTEWVALHRAAFGTELMTADERLAMVHGPDYDPQMDLVAVAADGSLAAYCMCQVDREENARSGRREGYADPIATHPFYQRRGLARALLMTGLRLLAEKGLDTAVMGTSSENERLLGLALSAGFRIESSKVWLARAI